MRLEAKGKACGPASAPGGLAKDESHKRIVSCPDFLEPTGRHSSEAHPTEKVLHEQSTTAHNTQPKTKAGASGKNGLISMVTKNKPQFGTAKVSLKATPKCPTPKEVREKATKIVSKAKA